MRQSPAAKLWQTETSANTKQKSAAVGNLPFSSKSVCRLVFSPLWRVCSSDCVLLKTEGETSVAAAETSWFLVFFPSCRSSCVHTLLTVAWAANRTAVINKQSERERPVSPLTQVHADSQRRKGEKHSMKRLLFQWLQTYSTALPLNPQTAPRQNRRERTTLVSVCWAPLCEQL